VAAFVTEGVCSKLLIRGRKGDFDLIACPVILKEFEQVFIKKFSAAKSETRDALRLLSEALSSIVIPSQRVEGICRDREDDAILACALSAEADYLVTGDADLLELGIFKRIKIIKPRDFELLFND
jgi:putative PIN family toxin of toxin-antitoxin system